MEKHLAILSMNQIGSNVPIQQVAFNQSSQKEKVEHLQVLIYFFSLLFPFNLNKASYQRLIERQSVFIIKEIL